MGGTERVDYDPYGEGDDIPFNSNYALDKSRFPLIITDNNDTTEGPNSHGIVLYNASGTAGSFAPSILFACRESDTTDYRTAISGIYSRMPLGYGGITSGDWSDGELIFATSGVLAGTTTNSKGLSQRMVIDRAGRVGINTTTPTEILDVDGNIKSTGNITATNATFDSLNYTTANDGDYLIYDSAQSKFVATQSNIIDDDTMATASASTLATSESIKAYVDASSADGFSPTTYAGEESVTLPNGLIMKFGTATASGNTATAVTFGAAFTATVMAQLSTEENTSDDRFALKIDSLSTTALTIINTQNVTLTVHWMAVGR